MIECGEDDEEVLKTATCDLEDSDEEMKECFIDWLIKESREAVNGNKKLAPYFFRYCELKSKNGKLTFKRSFVHQDGGF